MGLFDRFRKKVKQADDDTSFITEEGSELAEKAIAEREAALRSMNQEGKNPEETAVADSEWDDFDDDIALVRTALSTTTTQNSTCEQN